MKLPLLPLLILILSACSVYEPVPEGYQGPTATIVDSYSNKQPTSAHYFLLERIDGKGIASSWMASKAANLGHPQDFTPNMLSREVLPNQQTFTLVGLIFFPSEVEGRFADERTVQKTITFTPKPGEAYTVRGHIDTRRSDVWLEDSKGNRVSPNP